MSDELDFGDIEELDGEAGTSDDSLGTMEIDVDGTSGDHEATTCAYVSGSAGTGKTTEIRRRMEENPSYAVLSASTGIASVNLGAVTIHSLLGFFDTDSLRDAYLQGSAQRKLRTLMDDGFENVVLDEISMISNETLDLIVKIFDDVNLNRADGRHPIGLVCVGDFGQLAPIADKKPGGRGNMPTPWAFDAQCWPRFERNITRLTKVWRQADERFLVALNYARSGNGDMAVGALASTGISFNSSTDMTFDGTTIVSKNDEVDRFNQIALDRVQGRLLGLPSRRWGKCRPEWKNIPERTIIRENAYVMLLSNKRAEDGSQEFIYVNGDCGHVRGIQPSTSPSIPPSVAVELVRNGQIVYVNPLVRGVEHKDKPDGMTVEASLRGVEDQGRYIPKPHYRGQAKRYVTSQVEYYPIRLAYASTVHKIQGLSLDKVQIDFRSWFMKSPAMVYVSLSRARNLEGLRIVGMKEVIAANCKCDPRIKRWL